MSLDEIKGQIPDYAKDLKLNLSGIANTTSLSEQQLWGTVLSSALATGNTPLIKAAHDDAVEHLSDEAHNAAHAAASIMAMNNVYYRFLHLVSDDSYSTMPARLRMNVIGNPGVDKVDFELWSLAVSAINGCGMCIDAHEQVLRKADVSKEAIQDAVRIASIVAAVAATLDAHQATHG